MYFGALMKGHLNRGLFIELRKSLLFYRYNVDTEVLFPYALVCIIPQLEILNNFNSEKVIVFANTRVRTYRN